MNKQFTASEVRDWERAYKGTGAAKVFGAFADLLEADEKAVPVAYAEFTDGGCIRMWSRQYEERLPGTRMIPLYTHPAPADAEKRETMTPRELADARAELRLMTDECATLKAQSIHPRAQLLIMLGHANDRAEKAEAELAALKARISQSPIASVRTVNDSMGGITRTYVCHESQACIVLPSLDGKRVRLVVEE